MATDNNSSATVDQTDDQKNANQNVSCFDTLAVATRLFLKRNSKLDNTKIEGIKKKFDELCTQVFGYCNKLFIAIDGPHQKELIDILDPIKNNYDSNKYVIEYVVVSPWIGFTSALNSIIRVVSKYKFNTNNIKIKYLSFQSMEINRLSYKIVDVLINKYIDDNTLVAGPVLVKTQYNGTNNDNDVKVNDINGQNIPWNTLNIWNLNKLNMFGFSLISDGIIDNINGGIEEVVTISLIQQINGIDNNKCKLIQFAGNGFDSNQLNWNANFQNDNERMKYHEKKMKSKVERAELQLQQLKNLNAGKVTHIQHTL